MQRFVLGFATLAVAIVSTAAIATEDPILTRKKLMQSNGASMGAAQAMIKGEIPFSAAVAKAALQNFSSIGYAFGDYFPPGSEQGGETSASPSIWQDMPAFQAEVASFRTDADAALATNPQDLASFQAALGTIGRHCQSCHEKFRVKKN